MKLSMLYKDQGSGGGGCPSVYLAENGDFIVQGQTLDHDTQGNLVNVLPGEGAVSISPDIILGAIKAYQERIS
jgi:hypothetical protein